MCTHLSDNMEDLLRQCEELRPKCMVKNATDRKLKDSKYHNIYELLERHNISGAYVGMAALHPDHIYAELSPHISSIHSYEFDDTVFSSAKCFFNNASSIMQSNFQVIKGNIYGRLKEICATNKGLAIIDIDSNKNLFEWETGAIIEATRLIKNKTFILSLWHSYGRNITKKEHKRMLYNLADGLEDDRIKIVTERRECYVSNMTPMCQQIFVLQAHSGKRGETKGFGHSVSKEKLNDLAEQIDLFRQEQL